MFLHALQSSGDLSIESLQAMDLWAQGLFVVAVGLIGVFLVLTLFFFTIVLMQKISESAGKRAKPAAEADGSES
jgi:Na+-transporting methylmalonyl-CoA/oxaloacetate decarboxylase gamma subunit